MKLFTEMTEHKCPKCESEKIKICGQKFTKGELVLDIYVCKKCEHSWEIKYENI